MYLLKEAAGSEVLTFYWMKLWFHMEDDIAAAGNSESAT